MEKWFGFPNIGLSAPCLVQTDYLQIPPGQWDFKFTPKKGFCFFHIKHLNVNVVTVIITYKQITHITEKKIKPDTSEQKAKIHFEK